MSKCVSVLCAHCGKSATKSVGHVNRANKIGASLYCDKECAGLGRRASKTDAQKKEEKRLYDMEYRAKNLELIKAKKASYFKLTYDPVEAAAKRKEAMPRHVEYCRRPEYKAWKKDYDAQYLAKKQFGEFYESVLILRQIDEEVASRASKYEISLANGTINKAQTRRRNYERTHSNQS